jgi:thioredoxin
MQVITCPNCGAKNRVDETRAATKRPVCGRCGRPLSLSTGPVTVTDATFADAVLGVRGKPVLVDFWAPWCGPCRMLTPSLEQLAAESDGRYVIAKMNVDENPRTAGQYNISSIPAMFIFRDGKLVDQVIGLAPKPQIAAALARAGLTAAV